MHMGDLGGSLAGPAPFGGVPIIKPKAEPTTTPMVFSPAMFRFEVPCPACAAPLPLQVPVESVMGAVASGPCPACGKRVAVRFSISAQVTEDSGDTNGKGS